MKINIASKNQVKIDAVKEVLQTYPHIKDAEIFGIETKSGVSDQPKSLEETVEGAINRAKNSFQNCEYSFGIESGLMAVPNTKTGYMDFTVCAIFDGKEYHLGLSSAWEAPKAVAELMFKEGLDMSQAANKAGYTSNPEIGSKEGLIGIMTKGRLNRKEYTKNAIISALIHIDV